MVKKRLEFQHMMNKDRQNLVSLLKQTFEKGAWHGPAVKETLDGITAEQATARLPYTHSVIELVGHMTAWRRYAIKKLAGDSEYKVAEHENFAPGHTWPETLRQLEATQQELLTAVANLSAEKLHEQVPGQKNPLTFYTLLHGIMHHDLYHAGQIMLIKKQHPKQTL